MLKKYFFLLSVFFSHVVALSQDVSEKAQKDEWSTQKKVIFGVAAVAVVGVAGVTIYYGPVAVIAYIKAAAIAAKIKVVTVAAKAVGATHVVTLGEGAKTTTVALFGNGTNATTAVVGGTSFVVCAGGKAAGGALRDILVNKSKTSSVGSTIKVIKAFKGNQYSSVATNDEITGEDLLRAFNFTKGSIELVVDGIQKGLKADERDVEEKPEKEWVPSPLIADKIKQMYAKDLLQSSDVL